MFAGRPVVAELTGMGLSRARAHGCMRHRWRPSPAPPGAPRQAFAAGRGEENDAAEDAEEDRMVTGAGDLCTEHPAPAAERREWGAA